MSQWKNFHFRSSESLESPVFSVEESSCMRFFEKTDLAPCRAHPRLPKKIRAITARSRLGAARPRLAAQARRPRRHPLPGRW